MASDMVVDASISFIEATSMSYEVVDGVSVLHINAPDETIIDIHAGNRVNSNAVGNNPFLPLDANEPTVILYH